MRLNCLFDRVPTIIGLLKPEIPESDIYEQNTHSVSITRSNWEKLFKKIIYAYCKNHTKPINISS